MIQVPDDVDRIMAVMHAAFPPDFGEAWTRRQVEDAQLPLSLALPRWRGTFGP